MRARWLTLEPERGRQVEPVWASKRSAAASRKNSCALRRSRSVQPLSGEAFEFDRANFGAVLFLLRALLLVLVPVEFARGVSGAVEEVHRRPQEIVEVGFETGFAGRRDEGVEDVGERGSDGCLLGQGTRIGLILVRSAAVELQFVEEMAGGRCGVRGLEVGWPVECHGKSRLAAAAPIAAFAAIPLRRPGWARTVKRSGAAVAKRRTAEGSCFASRCKAGRFCATHFLAGRGRRRKTVA